MIFPKFPRYFLKNFSRDFQVPDSHLLSAIDLKMNLTIHDGIQNVTIFALEGLIVKTKFRRNNFADYKLDLTIKEVSGNSYK